jgi:hypothetical protein
MHILNIQMNKGIFLPVLLCFLLLFSCVEAESPEKYGYITVNALNVTLDEGIAEVHVDYTIDDSMKLLAFIFGQADLKEKVIELLGYSDVEMKYMDADSADLIINDTEVIYGEGLYWFPPHQFQVSVPELTITTPQSSVTYLNVTGIPEGICYYQQASINGT